MRRICHPALSVHEDGGMPIEDGTLYEFSAWVGKRYVHVDLPWYGTNNEPGRAETLLITRSLIDQDKAEE